MASSALHFAAPAWSSLSSTPRLQQIVGFPNCSSCSVSKREESEEKRQLVLGLRSCHVPKAMSVFKSGAVADESEETRQQESEERKQQVSDGRGERRYQASTKTKDSLVRRIQEETETRRDGDRDSTPAVRALTWALRGAQTEQAIAAVLGDLTFPLSIFTTVIQKLGMEKKPRAAVALLRYLQHAHGDLHPNVYTYNALLGVLKSNRCYDLAIEILEEMRRRGVASDIVTCNTVISMYDQQGRPEEAHKVYEDLRLAGVVPDLFTFRTMIQVLARSGGNCERVLDLYRDLQHQELLRPEKTREKAQRQELAAFVTQLCYRRLWAWLSSDASTIGSLSELFSRMQDTVQFTEKMCRDLIRACGQREIDHYLVKFLYFHMRAQGFYLNVSLCNHIIRVLGRGKRWWAALEVYENMMSVGPPPDETTHRLLLSHFQVLLGSASKRGIWKWALQLLHKMQEKGIEPDSFAWNAALIACARAHEPGSAIEVFQRMIACGQKPGVLSYGALLSALEKGNLSDKAEQVWEHMLKVGMMPNEYAYTTMITVRGKAGNYTKAVNLFHEMQRDGMTPSVVTYNAMITACARARDGLGAVKWLQQMEANCVQPDSITYSQIIGALSSANEWQLATSYYIRMRELELQIPCFVYDAVLKVCEANDAPVDHESIGPRPLDIKVHRGPDRRKPGGTPVIDVNIDAVVSTVF